MNRFKFSMKILISAVILCSVITASILFRPAQPAEGDNDAVNDVINDAVNEAVIEMTATPQSKPLASISATPQPTAHVFEAPFFQAVSNNTRQLVVVRSRNQSDVNVTVETYQRANDKRWNLIKSIDGVVGRKGLSADRREGDLTTPMGVFSFPFAFGSAANPGTRLEYRQTKPGDLWVSNPYKDEEYNVWLSYKGNEAKAVFHEYEDLHAISLYKYAAVVDFNYDSLKINGRGSAIFLHIAPPDGTGTAGCIGIKEAELLSILRWLEPADNPKIIIGTEDYLKNIKKPAEIKAKDGFVRIDQLDGNIVTDLRYATKDNFTGKIVYSDDIAILREKTAIKLAKVNLELREKGLRLKVWDAYRPVSVQQVFWNIVKDERYVANPANGPSRHNIGTAVDVTLVDSKGNELEMPSGFDDFSEKAHRNSNTMSENARKNMKTLTDAMLKHGFRSIDSEWWHFEDIDSSMYGPADIETGLFR